MIESNSANNIAFSKLCQQNVDLVTAVDCTQAPTLVAENINEETLTGVQSNFADLIQGGYQTSGRVVSGTVELEANVGGSTTTQLVYVVSEISDDAWNYNTSVESGAISLALTSPTI